MKERQKAALRKKAKLKRERLKPEDVQGMSAQIVLAFLEEFDLKGKKVLTYLPQKDSNEVDTWSLLNELFAIESVDVYVPAFNKEENSIIPAKISKVTKFKDDPLGIPAPVEIDMKDNDANIELDYIITPLIAFDLQGNRIGHGNGTYDRFLKSEAAKNALKIGFAYEVQLTGKLIPTSMNDVKLDYCITEERIYKFGS